MGLSKPINQDHPITLYYVKVKRDSHDHKHSENCHHDEENKLNYRVLYQKGKRQKWTYDLFLIMAYQIHQNKYDLSLIHPEDLKNGVNSRIRIRCIECDFIWETSVHSFVTKKAGCYACCHGQWNLKRFLFKAPLIHGNAHDYSEIRDEHIKGKESHVPIRCKICEHKWSPPYSLIH